MHDITVNISVWTSEPNYKIASLKKKYKRVDDDDSFEIKWFHYYNIFNIYYNRILIFVPNYP